MSLRQAINDKDEPTTPNSPQKYNKDGDKGWGTLATKKVGNWGQTIVREDVCGGCGFWILVLLFLLFVFVLRLVFVVLLFLFFFSFLFLFLWLLSCSACLLACFAFALFLWLALSCVICCGALVASLGHPTLAKKPAWDPLTGIISPISLVSPS